MQHLTLGVCLWDGDRLLAVSDTHLQAESVLEALSMYDESLN